MADKSHIEWTDATWNPLVGCSKVSPGCDNCYAEGVVTRWHAAGKLAFPTPFGTVSLRHGRLLTQPLHWTEPRRIFVNSLSDLFHTDVPTNFIATVFAIMALAPQHTFQLLTKRHGRMRSLLSDDHSAVSQDPRLGRCTPTGLDRYATSATTTAFRSCSSSGAPTTRPDDGSGRPAPAASSTATPTMAIPRQ